MDWFRKKKLQSKCEHTAKFHNQYEVDKGKYIKKEFKCTKCDKILSYTIKK